MPRILAPLLALVACTSAPTDDTSDSDDTGDLPARVEFLTPPGGLGCADESLALELLVENTEISFSSADPEIASVDSEGVVRPGYFGTTTIRAVSVDDPEVFDELEISVGQAWEMFADPTADQDVADGHPDRPWRYVDLLNMPLCVGGTLHLAQGVYEQVVDIRFSVTLAGPEATPPTAVIRPIAHQFPGSVIGVQGDDPDGSPIALGLEYVHVDGSAVQDIVYEPTSYLWFRGVLLEEEAEATIRNSRFSGFVGENPGDDNGICVHAVDSSVTVEGSVFVDCGWRAVDTLAVDGVASGVVNVRDSAFSGSDPAVTGVSATQAAVVLRNGVSGEVTGNTFTGFGPAGPAQVAYGGARVTADGEVGYAVRLGADAVTVSGNTFDDVQGVFLAEAASTITAAGLSSSNTMVDPTMALGPADEASEVRGQLAADPDQLNAVLLQVPCGDLTECTVTLSDGTWTLTEDMVDPPQPVTLVSTGTAAVEIPNASVPANVIAGAGVTFE